MRLLNVFVENNFGNIVKVVSDASALKLYILMCCLYDRAMCLHDLSVEMFFGDVVQDVSNVLTLKIIFGDVSNVLC